MQTISPHYLTKVSNYLQREIRIRITLSLDMLGPYKSIYI